MMNRIIRSTLAAALMFSVAGCSDDDNGLGPVIELTEAETDDLMEVLGTLAFEGTFGVPAEARTAIAMLRNPDVAFATVNVNQTLECPVSGSRHTNGSIVTNDEETQINASFTQTYTNCAATAESGTTWTFNTAPSLTLTITGTATDKGNIQSVTCSRSGVTVAATGTERWTCEVPLLIGDNRISVQATDAAGNQSFHKQLVITRR